MSQLFPTPGNRPSPRPVALSFQLESLVLAVRRGAIALSLFAGLLWANSFSAVVAAEHVAQADAAEVTDLPDSLSQESGELACQASAVACDNMDTGCIWARADYLAWWTKAMNTPPLVTTAPRGNPGFLGQPGTDVLVGDQGVFDNARNGGRLRVGAWLDGQHCWGIEAEYFALEDETYSFCDHSGGIPTLSRPFINALTGQPAVELIGFLPPVGDPLNGSGALCGAVDVAMRTSLQSAGVVLQREFYRCGDPCQGLRMGEFKVGYRYLQLSDALSVTENLTSLDPRVPNTAFFLSDQFDTRTEFNGVDLGLLWRRGYGRWSLDVLTKLAAGVNHQQVQIDGSTLVTNTSTGLPRHQFIGGLLTQETNIGSYSRDRFAVVPEVGLTLGYQVNDHVKAMFGYTFLYWSSVVRAGDQIDLTVNPNLLNDTSAGPARPAFEYHETGLWAQGLTLGVECAW